MERTNFKDILDSFSETGIYVITQDTHEILYFNRQVRELVPNMKIGKVCHEIWEGICQNCPLNMIGEKHTQQLSSRYNPFGEMVDIIANKMVWEEHIPAFVISITLHKLDSYEEKRLEEIGQLYAKSMKTLFLECGIVNLTQDVYINIYMGKPWKPVSAKGSYSEENMLYAKSVIHPNDYGIFLKNFSRKEILKAFNSGKHQISKKVRRKMEDGSYHWAEFLATRITDYGKGEVWGILVYRDIDEEYQNHQCSKIYPKAGENHFSGEGSGKRYKEPKAILFSGM